MTLGLTLSGRVDMFDEWEAAIQADFSPENNPSFSYENVLGVFRRAL